MSYFETGAAPGLGYDGGYAVALDPSQVKEAQRKAAAVATVQSLAEKGVAALQKTQAGKVIFTSGKTATQAYNMAKNAAKGRYTADANGVMNISKDAEVLFSSSISMMQSLNVSGSALREAQEWMGVTSACVVAAAAATTGIGAWGLVGCGLAFLAKLFDYMLPSSSALQEWRTPRSVYAVRDDAARAIVIADSVRLAQVLRHMYGVNSYASLRAMLGEDYPEAEFSFINTFYPDRPAVQNGVKLAHEPRYPGQPGVPAHNLRTIVQLMSFGRMPNWTVAQTNNRDAFALLAGYRTNVDPAGRPLYLRYHHDQDVSAQVIGNGAFFGRAAVATYGSPGTLCTVMPGGNLERWGRRGHPWQEVHFGVDWLPFIRVDELINYFGAITYQEIKRFGSSAVSAQGIGHANPVRSMFVRNSPDRRGLHPSDGGGAIEYGSERWTNLRYALEDNYRYERWSEEFRRVGYNNVDALREVGSMRLMAAFSYLHMRYMWSGHTGGERSLTDPIAQIAPINMSDPLDVARLPVDPRQVVPAEAGNPRGLWMLSPSGNDHRGSICNPVYQHGSDLNYGRVKPILPHASLCPATDAPTMRNMDVFRDSRTNATFLSGKIDKLSKDLLDAAGSVRVDVGTFLSAFQKREQLIAQERESTFKQFVRQTSPQQLQLIMRELEKKRQPPGASGAMLIGAAALAALLLLR